MTQAAKKSGAGTSMDRGSGQAADLMHVEAALAGAGRSARRMLITREVAWLVALIVAAALLLGLVDYAARLPWWLRSLTLAAGLGALAYGVVRNVLPAWRFRPTLTDLALRFERTPQGAPLKGVLASAIDLAEHPSANDPVLSNGAVREALEKFDSRAGFRSLLNSQAVRRRLLLTGACLVPAAVIAVCQPTLASIGSARVFTPWRHIEWPKRYAVADATGLSAAALGNAVPLKAVVYRTDRPPGKTDVWVKYRVITGESHGPIQRAPLTGQGRTVSAALDPSEDVKGELYERLIDPGLKIPAPTDTPVAAPDQVSIEYWFQADDDRTEPRTIRLVEPPAVLGATATIRPPSYSAGVAGGPQDPAAFASGAKDLGTGRDERASIGPVLAGSGVDLSIRLNKPVSPPEALKTVFPGTELPPDTALTHDGSTWRLTFSARNSLRLPIALTDDYGIKSTTDSVFQFQVVPDRSPAAAIIDPAQDESVLQTAIITVTGEGRDDVGLRSVTVEMGIATVPAESAGAPAEAKGKPSILVQQEASGTDHGLRVTKEIDLSTLGVKPRDEIWLWAIAADTYAGEEGEHEPVRSSMRRLRVISEGEFVESVRTELGTIRQGAIRLDQDQADVSKRLSENAKPAEILTPQDGISQRLEPLSEAVQKLVSRIERNNLADRSLAGMLADAASAVSEARSDAENASQEIRRAEQSGAPQLDEAQRQAVESSQRRVRDQLGKLISLLDSGQDGWALRREMSRLLEDQRRAMTRAGEVGQRTAGKSAEELGAGERDQLDQLAQQQQDLARRTGAMMDALKDRSEKVAKNDPALAQAMNDASRRGTKTQVQNKQRQAGEQLQKNQTGAAQQSQQKAAEALEQMLDDMDGAEKNRDRALRAAAEDVAASIGELITSQQKAIEQIQVAIPTASYAGLDRPMMALHASTLAVTEKIRSGYRELGTVADHLEGAAKAQETSVTILRKPAPDGVEAEKAERMSLDRLMQAKAEAERLMNDASDREQSRKRAELRKAYREALERQTALKLRTDDFVGKQLDRRERAGVRGLGDQQDEIRVALTDLRKNTDGLSDAKVFDFAHNRLETLTSRAANTLRDGAATAAVERDQTSTVRVLRSLVEALKDAKKGDFDKGASGSGGGEGSGSGSGQEPLVPPIAELRLLRGFQEDAAELTRLVHENPAGYGDEGIKDAAELQNKLVEQAQDLIHRSSGGGAAPSEKDDGKKSPEFGYFLPPDWKPPAKPGDKKEKKPESLDDLLGLPGEKQPEPAPDAPGPDAEDELDRALSPSEIADEFAKAVELMKQASGRLARSRDTGIDTQRLQEDVVKRLDQIISAAERNSQQQKSQQQKKQQQNSQPQSVPQQQQAQAGKTDNRAQADPPSREDGALKPFQPAPGSTWGNLPEHVRDALMQGRSDRFSSLYQALTEAYYRRLAEEAKPGTGKGSR